MTSLSQVEAVLPLTRDRYLAFADGSEATQVG